MEIVSPHSHAGSGGSSEEVREFSALAGTDARRGVDVAPIVSQRAVADSSAAHVAHSSAIGVLSALRPRCAGVSNERPSEARLSMAAFSVID